MKFSGSFTLNEAIDLANALRAGKLLATADMLQADEVGPTIKVLRLYKSGTNSFLIALAIRSIMGDILLW